MKLFSSGCAYSPTLAILAAIVFSGCRYAWTTADYADALLTHVGSDGRSKALALQDEALEIARELDMTPLVECVLARRELVEA